MNRIIPKSIIIIFYTLIFAAALYAPRIYNLFFDTKQVITIYTPREAFSLEKFEEFEEKTGIRVKVTYFNTNEEMFAKFKINRGRGYDIVVPSDYMVEHLIKAGLLQPLDYSKIKNFKFIDKRLLNKFYDPENKYTVPIFWIPYGIGFDKKFFNLDDTVSWDIMFKKEVLKSYGDYKISMLNDAREAVYLSAIYLFGTVDNLTDDQFDQIKNLLIAQKQIVESYGEASAKYLLLSGIVPIAVIPAARMKEIDDFENYGFVIPREGSLIDVMNMGIPVTSQKVDLAHKLIDFLLSAEVGAFNFDYVACNPVNTKAYSLINQKYAKNKAFFPEDEMFKRLFILNSQIRPTLLEKIWFLVKSA